MTNQFTNIGIREKQNTPKLLPHLWDILPKLISCSKPFVGHKIFWVWLHLQSVSACVASSACADIWHPGSPCPDAAPKETRLHQWHQHITHHRWQPASEFPDKMFGLIGFVFGIEWFMGRMCVCRYYCWPIPMPQLPGGCHLGLCVSLPQLFQPPFLLCVRLVCVFPSILVM